MPLLRLLVGLPFAPVKGLVALARQLQQQAEREKQQALAQLQAELLELELRYDRGELRPEDFAATEERLLQEVGAIAGGSAAGAGGDC
jgi:hypothetical protein